MSICLFRKKTPQLAWLDVDRALASIIGGLRSRERETLISNLERERDGRKIVVKWEEGMRGVSFIGIGSIIV